MSIATDYSDLQTAGALSLRQLAAGSWLERLPYKNSADQTHDNLCVLGAVEDDLHKPLWNGALEHRVIDKSGRLAQSVAASALHAEGRGFEPLTAHQPFKTIELTRGYVAVVSPEDYDRVVARGKWTAYVQVKNGFTRVYAYRNELGPDGKRHTLLLHRFILQAQPDIWVDHRYGSTTTLDCRRYNLRLATPQQNACNKVTAPSKHGYVGVDSQTNGRFRGRVCVDGRSHYTKTFPSPILAAAARDALARQLHGEYAVLNFPTS